VTSKKTNTLQLPCEITRKHIHKIRATTNPHYGSSPDIVDFPQRFNSGCILLDKPRGPTSHQIVAWIKKILDIEKAGHGGTLDPAVSGLLPIALGSATNALQVLLTAGKEYVGIMKIHKTVEPKRIREVIAEFVGDITQLPPVRSAVKRVRRRRQIYYFEVLEIQDREVLFRVGCEAGTYIRTLCVDIGKKLKTGAHLEELRRTRVGCLTEKSSVTLHQIKDAYLEYKENNDQLELKKLIHPIEYFFSHLPKIIIRDSAVDALCHGANLAVPGLVELDSDIKKGDFAAVFTLKAEVVALVQTTMSTEEMMQHDSGVCATLSRVLMNKGTYPSIWKKT
jgi:H/ACA ribonucleoprotein complex subunit 4